MTVPAARAEPAGRAAPARRALAAAAHDVRLVPVAAAAWSTGWWATGSTAGPVGTAALVAVLAAAACLAAAAGAGPAVPRVHPAGAVRALLLTAAASAVAVAVVATVAAHHLEGREAPPVRELLDGAPAEVVLRVRGDPVGVDGPAWRAGDVRVRAVLERVEGRPVSDVPVTVTGGEAWQEVRWGQRLATHVVADPAPAGAPVAAFTTAQGPPGVVREAAWPWRAAHAVRAGLVVAAGADGSSDGAGLLPGLVVGDTSGQPPGLADDMRAAGLTHLTAVSGSNVTIVCGGVLLAALVLGAGRRVGAVLAALALVGLVVVARPDPSVLRAAVMGAVGLLGLVLGRRGGGVPALAVAVTAVVGLDPWLARAPGFRLSVVATGALVLCAGPLARLLGRTLPRSLSLAVAVPAVAQAAVTPVLLGLEPVVPLWALPANVLAAPAVAPATVLGVLAALLSVVHPDVAALVAAPARWCAAWVAGVARAVAALPHATVPWPEGTTGVLLGAVAAALACAVGVAVARALPDRRHPRDAWAPWPGRRAALGGGVVAVLVGTLAVGGPRAGPWAWSGSLGGWPGPAWPVVVCDVGQGDSLLVRTRPGAAVVVDTGPDPAGVDGCLRAAHVDVVELLVLTHLHADHVGGLAGAVAGGRAVGQVWTAAGGQPGAALAGLHEWAAAHDVTVRTPAAGEVWRGGAVASASGATTVEVLAVSTLSAVAGTGASGTSQDVNDAGLVVRVVSADGLRVLAVGDLGSRAQERLLRSGADVSADLTTVAHHGSADQLPAFYRRVGADLAVASAGRDNPYGHPSPRALRVVGDAGAHVVTTADAGPVAVRPVDGGALAVRTAHGRDRHDKGGRHDRRDRHDKGGRHDRRGGAGTRRARRPGRVPA